MKKIVVGMHDYYSGLNFDSFSLTATFSIDENEAGANLAASFQPTARGVWEWSFPEPIRLPEGASIEVSVRDNAHNESRLVRYFGSQENHESWPSFAQVVRAPPFRPWTNTRSATAPSDGT